MCLNSIDSNDMGAEIQAFMYRIFNNCKISSQYYPESQCWMFRLAFHTSTGQYHIQPPKGCCLMNIQAMGQTVSFTIMLFVDDFKRYHAAKMMN